MGTFAKILLTISLILNFIFIWTTYNYKPLSSNDTNKFITTIDSLKLKLDSLGNYRDSVKQEIDTIIVELENNDKEYENLYNTILNNSTSADYVFFSEYLKSYRERLDSTNNGNTIKGN